MTKLAAKLHLCRFKCYKWYVQHKFSFHAVVVLLHVVYYSHVFIYDVGIGAYASGAIAGFTVYQWFTKGGDV